MPAKTLALNAVTQPIDAPNGAPEWVHLTPAGTFTGYDGRGPFSVGDANAVIARSMPGGRKLPIDENHAIDLQGAKGGSSPARGWIVALQNRDDGIWGKVEWTAEGRRLIEEKHYGFLSPVFEHDGGATQKNIMRLSRAALTNSPNLVTLTALHAAGAGTLEEKLKELLGLAADATEDDILAKISEMKTSMNSADPAKFVPMDVFKKTLDELHRVNAGVSQHTAEVAVENAIKDGRIMPFMRQWATELCTANKPIFDSFVEVTSPAVKSMFAGGISREQMKHLELNSRDPNAGTDNEILSTLGLSADDVKKYGGKETV